MGTLEMRGDSSPRLDGGRPLLGWGYLGPARLEPGTCTLKRSDLGGGGAPGEPLVSS